MSEDKRSLYEQVQRVKRKFGYIGTKQAYDYVKAERRADERVQRYAAAVNDSLEGAMFQASPMRLVIFHEAANHYVAHTTSESDDTFMRIAKSTDPVSEEDQNSEEDSYTWQECKDFLDFTSDPFVEISYPEKKELDGELLNLYTRAFKTAQSKNVQNDQEFYSMLLHEYFSRLQGAPLLSPHISTQMQWNPQHALKKWKKRAIAYAQERAIRPEDIVQRMQNDLVENNYEYQRRLLDLHIDAWIEWHCRSEMTLDEMTTVLRKNLDDKIQRQQQRIEKIKRYALPALLPETFQRVQSTYLILRKAFAHQRNYVRKRLAEHFQRQNFRFN